MLAGYYCQMGVFTAFRVLPHRRRVYGGTYPTGIDLPAQERFLPMTTNSKDPLSNRLPLKERINITMTSANPPPTPKPTPQAKKKRNGFMCFNIKFAHAIRNQPIVLATMVMSSLLAVASGSMVWYVTAFASAPWNIKQLDDHLTAVEKNANVRFQRIETTVQGEIEKDNRDRELLRQFIGRLDTIENLLKIIASK